VDDEAFRAVLLNELPRLRRLAGRLAPPGQEPDDLAQDVLERAWRTRARFRAAAQPSTWLHRMMLNRVVDLTRRAPPAVPIDAEDWRLVEIDDPAAVVARAEDEAELRQALSRLDPRDRTALVLFDGEGLSAEQVSQVCGGSATAIHKRVQRARWRLARQLASRPDGQPASGPADEECLRARTRAPDYLDGQLDPGAAAAVDRHLRHCGRCPPIVQALVGVRAALGADAESQVPEAVRLAVEAAITEPPDAG
jgi:RNA polymerase sigma factor (sigma-70 family)